MFCGRDRRTAWRYRSGKTGKSRWRTTPNTARRPATANSGALESTSTRSYKPSRWIRLFSWEMSMNKWIIPINSRGASYYELFLIVKTTRRSVPTGNLLSILKMLPQVELVVFLFLMIQDETHQSVIIWLLDYGLPKTSYWKFRKEKNKISLQEEEIVTRPRPK